MVNDIIRSKEKKTARKDERRDVYSAVTARANEKGNQYCRFKMEEMLKSNAL